MISPKAESEKITKQILRAISMFEGMEDAPPELINGILINTALRQKMALPQSDEEQIALIKEALIEQNIQVMEQNTLVEQQASELRTKLIVMEQHMSEVTGERQTIRDLLEQERRTNQELSEKLQREEAHRVAIEIEQRERFENEKLIKAKRVFWVKLLIWLIVTISANIIMFLKTLEIISGYAVIIDILLLGFICVIMKPEKDILSSYQPYIIFNKLIIGFFSIVVLGVIINILSDLFKWKFLPFIK